MHIKSLFTLDHSEVVDLAEQAAERGEELALANPFPEGSWRHTVFRDVFAARVADLQPIG
ncbi:hypothetical protein [Variovorax paradoxus]|uniref:Uncharacterized protein n=1 Tax=Variovorax paradoxus (strain EPS) TaxID=595537 RepID=E6V9Q9_VARPE|nr:hypothetical protein [Variovorax paradoxus]ADU36197.1 hypothetical protein Varpa_1989 [Variovorax paradoxus EPS]